MIFNFLSRADTGFWFELGGTAVPVGAGKQQQQQQHSKQAAAVVLTCDLKPRL